MLITYRKKENKMKNIENIFKNKIRQIFKLIFKATVAFTTFCKKIKCITTYKLNNNNSKNYQQ